MKYGRQIAKLLDGVVDRVSEVLCSQPSAVCAIAKHFEFFERSQKLFHWLYESGPNACGNVRFATSAAVVSDLLHTIKESILADHDVEDEELELAKDVLSDVIYRYARIEEYKCFSPLMDIEEVRQLFAIWENDARTLGGDYSNGAAIMPFSKLVMVASMLREDISLYDAYEQSLLMVVRIILAAGGTDRREKEFHQTFKEYRDDQRRVVVRFLEGLRSRNALGQTNQIAPSSKVVDRLSPKEAIDDALKELNQLVGVNEVKAEVSKLSNFLKVRQQRIDAGLPVPNQSLHFVFTGNPGTGKTTVARIVSRLLYGFQILKSPSLVEADRAALVAGYVGQTAIKTSEVIDKAIDGVLFIDEAYTLVKKEATTDFGQEAIDTLLKKMEDLRDRLVIIVAGYPQKMQEFLSANPGLESRFTRFIEFEDYHVADLCRIFERLCEANEYRLTQSARANLAILLNRAYTERDEKFGNARFIRNLYERTLGNHADRIASFAGVASKEALSTIEPSDLPFDMVRGFDGPFEVSNSKWIVKCPGCERIANIGVTMIGNRLACRCGAVWRCPWWNLDSRTVDRLVGFTTFDRPQDQLGFDVCVSANPARKK